MTPRRPAPLDRLASRREFVAVGLGACLVATLPLARRRRPSLVRRTIPVMGTIAEVTVVHGDTRVAEGAIDAAFAELLHVDRTMSRFSADSDIGRVNAGAFLRPVAVTPDTRAVIDAALRWARASDGAFDPAIGLVVELWDVAHRHAPPPEAAYRRLAGRQLYHRVETGMEHGQPVVSLGSRDVHLDLGAIAKGYGVDRAADALRAWKVEHALLNVGGEIVAVGTGRGGDPWQVGIQSPDDARDVRAVVSLENEALATSGTYEQYFRWRGHTYHHLMDPATATPRKTAIRTVTVRAATCMDADAASTAVFGQPTDAAAHVLARATGASIHLVDMA